jgi:hypothetical protein
VYCALVAGAGSDYDAHHLFTSESPFGTWVDKSPNSSIFASALALRSDINGFAAIAGVNKVPGRDGYYFSIAAGRYNNALPFIGFYSIVFDEYMTEITINPLNVDPSLNINFSNGEVGRTSSCYYEGEYLLEYNTGSTPFNKDNHCQVISSKSLNGLFTAHSVVIDLNIMDTMGQFSTGSMSAAVLCVINNQLYAFWAHQSKTTLAGNLNDAELMLSKYDSNYKTWSILNSPIVTALHGGDDAWGDGHDWGADHLGTTSGFYIEDNKLYFGYTACQGKDAYQVTVAYFDLNYFSNKKRAYLNDIINKTSLYLPLTGGTLTGLLTANAGISSTTGTFSGLLTANNGLTVNVNNGATSALTVLNNGNVGIGTIYPGLAKLQVDGDIYTTGAIGFYAPGDEGARNALYRGGTNFTILRNYNEVYTIFDIWAPPGSLTNREATISLIRGDEPNQEFIDLYNDGYSSETQFGIRIQKRGTGQFRDFVFDQSDGNTKTPLMILKASGNIGIGYTTDTEIGNNKLSVNGNGYFNGNIQATSFVGGGSSLTSLPTNTSLYPTFNQDTTGKASNITSFPLDQSVSTTSHPTFAELTVNGDLSLPSIGSSYFKIGNGDSASMATCNIDLAVWNGLGLWNPTTGGAFPNQRSIYFDIRNGAAGFGGGISATTGTFSGALKATEIYGKSDLSNQQAPLNYIYIGSTDDNVTDTVILLHPAYNGTAINKYLFDGIITFQRGGNGALNISDNYEVKTSTAYTTNTGSIISRNTSIVANLVTCTYNSVLYVAIYVPKTSFRTIYYKGDLLSTLPAPLVLLASSVTNVTPIVQDSTNIGGSLTVNSTLTANNGLTVNINNGTTNALTVLNSGNVGIGTTPAYKLDVSGDIQATTNYRSSSNNIILSDTSGTVFRGVRASA